MARDNTPPSIPLLMRRIATRSGNPNVSLLLYREGWGAEVYLDSKSRTLSGYGGTAHAALDDLGRRLGEAGL